MESVEFVIARTTCSLQHLSIAPRTENEDRHRRGEAKSVVRAALTCPQCVRALEGAVVAADGPGDNRRGRGGCKCARKSWVRLVEVAILTLARAPARQRALHQRRWAASREAMLPQGLPGASPDGREACDEHDGVHPDQPEEDAGPSSLYARLAHVPAAPEYVIESRAFRHACKERLVGGRLKFEAPRTRGEAEGLASYVTIATTGRRFLGHVVMA